MDGCFFPKRVLFSDMIWVFHIYQTKWTEYILGFEKCFGFSNVLSCFEYFHMLK